MRDMYGKNEMLFFVINLVMAIVAFVLYSLEDTSGLVLLFFFIFLVNGVCSLSFYKTIKEVSMSANNVLKIGVSIIANIATYAFLALFILRLF